ncbi:nucleotidyl transferase AbiEii/AbiGii toxin family protein [Olivibacter sitiensis]|uniref:nucleotidyl transferase AbiEii/AbiGii toxin family protein n=1 Tax=Olivibacter sitiensis TaxID=376470 RepID=UPI00048321D6|nr:nucleotidyl transferase AbiEii/AbiGii toxin family protein [Olivibacter sitiensis]
MRLHENKQLFRQAVQFTAQEKDIREIYVEKDYWVTYALHTIFNHKIGEEAVFKGGTALLKCYDLIQRFSEDIDLVVLRREGESNNKLTTKIRQISGIVNTVLPEVDILEVTQKMGMNRKTAHTYAKEFNGDYGQVRDVIIVEATWLGYYEPYTTKAVNSFIYEMMIKTGQEVLIAEYGLQPFEVKVLEPKRTLCEKIMSLVRFSYTEKPLDDLKAKIRHTYDLRQLLKDKELSDFLHSSAFDEMLLKVANDDVVSFKNNNDWLIHHPNEALMFRELETVWGELQPIYSGDFKKLVFADFPKDIDVLATLQQIKQRLTSVKWTIKVD